MKRTICLIYNNRYNSAKFLEVHLDGYGHYSVRQYMKWKTPEKKIVRNYSGDGKLHRVPKKLLLEILQDY